MARKANWLPGPAKKIKNSGFQRLTIEAPEPVVSYLMANAAPYFFGRQLMLTPEAPLPK
jgi:hypothetical protein